MLYKCTSSDPDFKLKYHLNGYVWEKSVRDLFYRALNSLLKLFDEF